MERKRSLQEKFDFIQQTKLYVENNNIICKLEDHDEKELDEFIEKNINSRDGYFIHNNLIYITSIGLVHNYISSVINRSIYNGLYEASLQEYLMIFLKTDCLIVNLLGGKSKIKKYPNIAIGFENDFKMHPFVAFEIAVANETFNLLILEAAAYLNEYSPTMYCIAVKVYPKSSDFKMRILLLEKKKTLDLIWEQANIESKEVRAKLCQNPNFPNMEDIDIELIEHNCGIKVVKTWMICEDQMENQQDIVIELDVDKILFYSELLQVPKPPIESGKKLELKVRKEELVRIFQVYKSLYR